MEHWVGIGDGVNCQQNLKPGGGEAFVHACGELSRFVIN